MKKYSIISKSSEPKTHYQIQDTLHFFFTTLQRMQSQCILSFVDKAGIKTYFLKEKDSSWVSPVVYYLFLIHIVFWSLLNEKLH